MLGLCEPGWGEMMRARILLVDDHEVSRAGLRSLLAPVREWEICGEATNGRDAVEKVHQLKPDVVIMDAVMPMMSGIEATRQMRELFPELKIIMTSVHDSSSVLQLALLVGADAFLTKTAFAKNFREAISNLLEASPLQPAVSVQGNSSQAPRDRAE